MSDSIRRTRFYELDVELTFLSYYGTDTFWYGIDFLPDRDTRQYGKAHGTKTTFVHLLLIKITNFVRITTVAELGENSGSLD